MVDNENTVSAGGTDGFLSKFSGPTYTVSGTVLVDSSPLSGVTVNGGPLGSATTNALGQYSISGVPYNTAYSLNVSKAGVTFAVGTASGTVLVNVTENFSGALDRFTITGTVTDNGTPLSAVSVSAGGLGSTVSGPEGKWGFSNIAYGTVYSITLLKDDYTFSPKSFSGTLTTNTVHNSTGTKNLPPETTPPETPPPKETTSTVSGTIEQNGTPVEGATVTIEAGGTSQSTTTNEQGEYTFTNVPTGEGTISAEKGGTTLLEEELTVTPGTTEPAVEIDDTGLTSPAVTFWNGFLGMINVLELVNTSASKAEPRVVLYDLHGDVLSTTVFAVEAGSQRDVIVNDLEGFSATSYGIVSVVSDDNPLDGRITYYIPGEDGWGKSYDLVFSLPFFNPHRGASHAIYNSYNPSKNAADQEYLVPTWLSVANLGTSTETFDIQYRGQDGSEIATAELSIPPNGKRDIQAGHEFSGSAAVGLVTVTPPNPATPYVATVTRYGRKAEEGRYGYGFGVPTRSGNSSKMVIPVSNSGEVNAVELVNTVNATNAVSLIWYDQDGNQLRAETRTLPAYRQEHLIVSDILPEGTSGSLLIDASSPVIAGSASYFYHPSSGEVLSATYIEASEAFGRIMSGTYNTYLDMTNWLRVINLSDNAQDVTIDYGDTSASLRLQGHARRDMGIPSDTTSVNSEYGSFKLQSTVSGVLSSSVVRVRSGAEGYDFMSVSPVR
jgi:hypothetical protein